MFGATLRRLREDRGFSQSRLAERARLDHSYVSRMEAGDRKPSRGTVNDLAAALACTEAEQDVLLMAAGFTNGQRPRVTDPNLLLLDEALQDDRLPDGYRAALRSSVAALLQGCEALRSRQRVAVVHARDAA